MDLGRHARTVMVAICALVSTAAAKDKAPPKDEVPDAEADETKAARDQGTVITDGKGHYIVFASPDPGRSKMGVDRAVFYGDGKTFYRVHIKMFGTNSSPDNLKATWAIVDERFGLNLTRSEVSLDNSGYRMKCRDDSGVTPLTVVAPAAAREMLAKAAFKRGRLDRMALGVGRDGTTYYYVDTGSRSTTSTDYRVYVGKRGAMKLLKVTHTADDTKGVVFTAKSGTLRLTIEPLAMSWAPKPNKQIELSTLPIENNLELVYAELGIYAGKKFGVPCDDM